VEKDDVHLSDVKRILIGNAPPEFLLEVVIRTLFIYISLVVIVRLFGKRLSARATLTEMALSITLGAIVGSPMQIPERGLIAGTMILLLALIFQQVMNRLSFKSGKLEELTQGKVTTLVLDSVLDLAQMRKDRISRTQLFASLRDKKIRHLGQTTRVYLEADGQFSVICNQKKRAGLSVLPEEDPDVSASHISQGTFVCSRCGTISHDRSQPCKNCKAKQWGHAIE
jgi:uncharacterized membrane protein YcaP (DUF421 family)